MGRSRYVVGWALVLALAVGVSLGSLVLVRSAVGGGNAVASLSPADVSAQYAAAQASHGTSTTATSPDRATSSAGSATPSALAEPTGGSAPADPDPSAASPLPTHSAPGRSATDQPPAPRPTTSPAAVTRVLTSAGGSVVVRCTGSGGSAQVYLVSWSPAQGYSVDHAQRGPGEEAEIEFESDAASVSVNYHCSSSGPVQTIENGDGWGSGGDDGGGGHDS